MTAYQERESIYERNTAAGYNQISRVAKSSPYPNQGNGKQFYDFCVGTKGKDKVTKVRVLIDFRGEYFSSFISTPIFNKIHFTAEDAYRYIIQKAKELNM